MRRAIRVRQNICRCHRVPGYVEDVSGRNVSMLKRVLFALEHDAHGSGKNQENDAGTKYYKHDEIIFRLSRSFLCGLRWKNSVQAIRLCNVELNQEGKSLRSTVSIVV